MFARLTAKIKHLLPFQPSARIMPEVCRLPMSDWPPGSAPGGKIADMEDLADPGFAAEFRHRFERGGMEYKPRKLWEMAWLAQAFENLRPDGVDTMLGLGVGNEPLIYHYTHRAQRVIATDLYSSTTSWNEARRSQERVFEESLFPYKRERLSVQNMDMRKLQIPDSSIDAIWSCSSVEHVQTLPEFVQTFRECHRVLKPGGIVLITTEFSLGEPYFLPGVLSLWPDCHLFTRQLGGLRLIGPVDCTYRAENHGNEATPRKDAEGVARLWQPHRSRRGLVLHAGYTQLIPVAFALQKVEGAFDWPEYLGAPAWYIPFCRGIEKLQDERPAAAIAPLQQAAASATLGGARLHCIRYLLEAQAQAGMTDELKATLDQFKSRLEDMPADDDALDLIAYVAAAVEYFDLAQECFEKAFHAPSALTTSRLRIRVNQLETEIKRRGPLDVLQHRIHQANEVWQEALEYPGPSDPTVKHLTQRLEEIVDCLFGANAPAKAA
jgi:SAM-dependent methyltransferase